MAGREVARRADAYQVGHAGGVPGTAAEVGWVWVFGWVEVKNVNALTGKNTTRSTSSESLRSNLPPVPYRHLSRSIVSIRNQPKRSDHCTSKTPATFAAVAAFANPSALLAEIM